MSDNVYIFGFSVENSLAAEDDRSISDMIASLIDHFVNEDGINDKIYNSINEGGRIELSIDIHVDEPDEEVRKYFPHRMVSNIIVEMLHTPREVLCTMLNDMYDNSDSDVPNPDIMFKKYRDSGKWIHAIVAVQIKI